VVELIAGAHGFGEEAVDLCDDPMLFRERWERQWNSEVAHEAIFRRWDKLREWIAAEREFLAWRSGLESARRAWQATPDASKHDALLMGAALTQAQSQYAKRAEDLPKVDQEFIALSIERERKTQTRARRVQALIYVLLVGIIGSLGGIFEIEAIKEQLNWFTVMRPYRVANFDRYVLKPDAEHALKPLANFRECAKDCPEMIFIPAGEFTMGSPAAEQGRFNKEGPQHRVTIAKPFAVSKYDVTFADWDACVSVGACPKVRDAGFGRDTRPVIYVYWDDAQTYVALQDDWAALPSVDRGGMGICGSRWHHDGLLLGRRHRQGERQLQRVRQPVGRTDLTGRLVRRESVWPLRHGGQRVAMGAGLLS
jgi:hypothetical protein